MPQVGVTGKQVIVDFFGRLRRSVARTYGLSQRRTIGGKGLHGRRLDGPVGKKSEVFGLPGGQHTRAGRPGRPPRQSSVREEPAVAEEFVLGRQVRKKKRIGVGTGKRRGVGLSHRQEATGTSST